MSRNIHWSVQLAVLVGLIGVGVMSLSFWVGASMVLLGLVVSILGFRQSKKTAVSTPRPAVNSERKPAPAARSPHRSLERKITPPAGSAQHRVDRNKLGVLRYTLHQASLDSNAPVFETDDHKIVTVRDILGEMIRIADDQGRPIEALAKEIAALYPKIFENAELALRQYPDEELAKRYIAQKVMKDIKGE